MSRLKLKSIPFGMRLALVILVLFMSLHLAGLRDWVSIVSGTPVPDVPLPWAVFGGLVYVLSWFALVIVAPVLALASLLHALVRRWRGSRATRHTESNAPITEANTTD